MAGYPSGVRCPSCAATDTRVIDSRSADQGSSIRRRRVCEGCGYRFTTYERAEPLLLVRKRSGRIEPFQADKLAAGITAALTDRPVGSGAIAELVAQIESEIAEQVGPVASEEIGRKVLERLRRLDEVAYLRFASVYKDFQAVTDFEKELAAMEGGAH
jgi:transcriptional repressor NrdR